MTLPSPSPSITKLRNYQVDGIRFLKTKQRAALHDQPGLGKTIQAIRASITPVLVICPTYLTYQWQDQILADTFADPSQVDPAALAATVQVAQGTRPERTQAIANNAAWTIINPDMLLTYTFDRNYQTLIIDEAHHFRVCKPPTPPQKTNTFLCALALARRIPRVYQLTATPIMRECDDLFAQFLLLDPARFMSSNGHPNRGAFVQTYCNAIDIGFERKVVGPKDATVLHDLIAQYALRRTYARTHTELPPIIQQDILIDPGIAWLKAYNDLKRSYRADNITFDNAAELLRTLRAATAVAKLERLKAIQEDNNHTNHILYFTWYRETAHAIAAHLSIPCITGELNPKLRHTTARTRNTSIVANIAALSEGIDLSHLHTVVFVEQSYLPGEITQALARVRRWSPDIQPVRALTLLVKGTIDVTINRTVGRRGADTISILRDELSMNPLTDITDRLRKLSPFHPK